MGERFDRQPEAYRTEVLPGGVKKIAIEAGVSGLWYKYAEKVVGVDAFGFSAPGGSVMDAFGINAGHLADVAQATLAEAKTKPRSSKFHSTQSETWSRFERKTIDSLPGIHRSGTLGSMSSLASLGSVPELEKCEDDVSSECPPDDSSDAAGDDASSSS